MHKHFYDHQIIQYCNLFRYPEVTPKHELNEEGQPGFFVHTTKAAEHLYAIIDGKPKDVLGTTYAHIKHIVTSVHECGYFDKGATSAAVESEDAAVVPEEEQQELVEEEIEQEIAPVYAPPTGLPVPPAPAVVPAPAYPLRPLPPITLQEVEHAYFAQQYPQQRPISEVIGSQNFIFLQESEIDSPVGTPQPQPMMNQPSPSAIPTQTFTNQHFIRVPEQGMPLPPQPHFPPHPEHAAFAGVMPAPLPTVHTPPHPAAHPPAPLLPPPAIMPAVDQVPVAQPEEKKAPTPVDDKNDDEWQESRSPERDENGDRKTQGQGDGQNRFRRYGRGRGTSNGYRGRGGAFQSRQGNDYHNRHGGEYQGRSEGEYQGRSGGEYQARSGKESYQNRQYSDGYQSRHGKDGYQNRRTNDGYYGNGDAAEGHQQNENGTRDRYDNNQRYHGDFKSRGRGNPRGGARGAPRGPRPQHYNRKPENVE